MLCQVTRAGLEPPGFEGDYLVACLRGEMLLRVRVKRGEAWVVEEAFKGVYGRLSDVVVDEEGYLLIANSY